MQDGRKAVWSIPYVCFCGIFPSLKQNFIAYLSSKVFSRPDCIFEIHQLWQSGFSRVYSNCCCSCSFEPEIKKLASHLIRCIAITYWIFKSLRKFWIPLQKSLESFWIHHTHTHTHTHTHIYIYIYISVCVCKCRAHSQSSKPQPDFNLSLSSLICIGFIITDIETEIRIGFSSFIRDKVLLQ